MSGYSVQVCRGSGELFGRVHKYPNCDVYMHLFCGTSVVNESFGQLVHCSAFSRAAEHSVHMSSSTSAAFARVPSVVERVDTEDARSREVETTVASSKRAPPSVSTTAKRVEVAR